MKTGDIVRPIGDGEDDLGRVLKNSRARLRVLAVDGDTFTAAVVRPGGMWKPGGRIVGLRLEAFVQAHDVADRPAAARVRTVQAHEAIPADYAAEASYAAHLAYLSHA